jgi:hypothetical protein
MPAQQLPPPAFDQAFLPPPTQRQSNRNMFDPFMTAPTAPEPQASAPPAPSAPSFEEIYAMPPPDMPWETTLAAPSSFNSTEERQQQAAPLSSSEIDPAMLEAILGLEGLSDAEKQALIDEQFQILSQMQQPTASSRPPAQSAAASAADAFEQRSLAGSLRNQQQQSTRSSTSSTITKQAGTHAGVPTDASLASQVRQQQPQAQRTVNLGSGQQVPLHGQERTQQAIGNGTALVVQCLGCENYMQVTPAASLMFCPVCETVSAVNDNNTMMGGEDAQLQADMKLAEELQKEEYKRAEGPATTRSASRGSQSAASPARASPQRPATAESGGWLEWLGMSSAAAPAAASPRSATSSTRSSPSRPTGLVPANTETIHFSSSSNNDPLQARVAEPKPLFSCVADSILTTANQYMTATSSMLLDEHPDEEGNVHGVDSSSLLAMPSQGVGRNSHKQSDEGDGYQAYGN